MEFLDTLVQFAGPFFLGALLVVSICFLLFYPLTSSFVALSVALVCFAHVMSVKQHDCPRADHGVYGLARGVEHKITSVNASKGGQNGGFLELGVGGGTYVNGYVRGRCVKVPGGMMRYAMSASTVFISDTHTYIWN